MERIPLNFIPDFPPVTQMWAIGAVVSSLLVDGHFLKQTDMTYVPSLVFRQRQYWRLITCFLYMGPLDLSLLLSLYNVMTYSKQLEESWTRSKNYLWFLLVNCSLLIVYATFYKNHYFLSNTLTDALMYYWARKNPDSPIGVLAGLIQFRAAYFGFFNVFIYLFIRAVTGASMNQAAVVDSLTGIILGHLLFYFDEVFKNVHGFNPLCAAWEWDLSIVRRLLSGGRRFRQAHFHQD